MDHRVPSSAAENNVGGIDYHPTAYAAASYNKLAADYALKEDFAKVLS
jgi:hypothetical protein